MVWRRTYVFKVEGGNEFGGGEGGGGLGGGEDGGGFGGEAGVVSEVGKEDVFCGEKDGLKKGSDMRGMGWAIRFVLAGLGLGKW